MTPQSMSVAIPLWRGVTLDKHALTFHLVTNQKAAGHFLSHTHTQYEWAVGPLCSPGAAGTRSCALWWPDAHTEREREREISHHTLLACGYIPLFKGEKYMHCYVFTSSYFSYLRLSDFHFFLILVCHIGNRKEQTETDCVIILHFFVCFLLF